MNTRVWLYSVVGEEFTCYEVDVDNATFVKHESIKVPAGMQYAWPHPSGSRNFKHHFLPLSNQSRDGLTVNRVNFRQAPVFY